ncbi:GAF domain-containing protein [Tepidiforma sp.]|uniref:GAF domain-containing protein n=1 Tax=Tepidiforma sp. TaxID=2682230 RepID=UPI002615C079|nr:GAF domain-containing protein [Tepidiforma sp.]MCX7618626.1 GAF domain-containing protein [Tepidiforma sp.]
MGETAPAGSPGEGGRPADSSLRAWRAGAADAGSIEEELTRFAEAAARALGGECGYVALSRRGRRAFWWPLEGEHSPGRWPFDHRQSDAAFSRLLADEGGAVFEDTLAIPRPTPGQRAAIAAGVRSTVRLPLTDERGQAMGFVLVGSVEPGRFSRESLGKLWEVTQAAMQTLRPLLLLERMEFERAIRAAEADLLAAVAAAEDEAALLAAAAEGVRAAVGADAAIVMVEGGPGGEWTFRSAPAGLLTPALWEEARRAALDPGNRPMGERDGSLPWVRESLESGDGLLAAERFARERLGMGSLAAAVRTHRWGAGLRLALVALRKEPSAWAGEEQAFLGRVARVLEIGVERVRRGELAVAHALTLERQAELLSVGAELLETLWQARELAPACQAIAERLRAYFEADHVALGTVDLERRVREVLGMSSAVMQAADLPPGLTEEDVTVYRAALAGQGGPAGDIFARPAPNPGTLLGYERGLRSGMRVPFALSDGTVGLVTIGSREPGRYTRADEERLMELARPMAIAIDRVRLLAQMAEASELLEAKTRMLLALTPGASMRQAGDVFVREVRRLFGASHAVVVTTAPGDIATLTSSTAHFRDEELERVASLLRQHPVGWRRLVESGPVLITDAAEAADEPTAFLAAHGLRSVMRAPIRDGDGVARGIATVAAPAPGRWDAADLAQFADLAATLGTVLERAFLMESAREQARRARAMLEVLSALGSHERLEELAAHAAAALRQLYGADHCAIGVVERAAVRLAGIDSPVGAWSPGAELPAEQVFDAWPPAGPVVHVIEDLQEAPRLTATSEAARAAGIRSSMRVAIVCGDGVCGVVTLGAREPGRFGRFDAEQLAEAVQPLGLAIRYFRSREEQARRTARLEATTRILARLNAGGTAERVAQRFLADCRALFGAEFGIVFAFEPGQPAARRLALDSSRPLPMDAFAEEVPVGRLRGAALQHAPAPQVVPDAREETPLHPGHRALLDAGLLSVIRVPLVVHESVRGSVALWAEGTDRFTAEDAELLGTLARPLALALEKASALESLAESELKYRSLVAQAEEMILTVDAESRRILDANPFAARVLGYAQRELHGLRLDDISMADEAELASFMARIHADGEVHLADVRYRKRDGSPLDVEVVASLVAYGGREAVLVLARDVSERKALMAQLMQSQKMESLGTMAGAVAHDFNNLLTTILGFAGLLKRSRNLDADERENVALIEEAARKAADLTGRLLAFARGGLVRFGQVDLRTVVEDTLQLLAPALHSRIAVTVSLPDEPLYVEGDAGQLQQALTNIVLNARDVMPEGGRIAIRAGATGPLAWVEVADTGPGMTDDVRMRIFEPFYTTKAPGAGTGLGMAITYGIVQGHHGDITVDSEPGRGTTFTLSFPLRPAAGDGRHDAFSAGDGNLILVVDDDAMVRRALAATLGELGYNVVEAPGGATAVEIVRARPERFAAVMLDLVMPGMTGSETFRALTEIRPDLPVIVCTGYAADSHIDTDVKRRIAGLVQKPFTAERLARALEAAGARPPRK